MVNRLNLSSLWRGLLVLIGRHVIDHRFDAKHKSNRCLVAVYASPELAIEQRYVDATKTIRSGPV
jgi:hypothetical protein